jgi:hypothetical protein
MCRPIMERGLFLSQMAEANVDILPPRCSGLSCPGVHALARGKPALTGSSVAG